MAINLELQYPGKINPSNPDYPYGSARNVTTPGDGTGTPWEAAIVNDILGLQQALLQSSGVVPSGTPETALASQFFEALKRLFNTTSVFALTLAGSNVALSDEQSYSEFIVLSGTLTASVEVSAPTRPRKWFVINNTTGAFTVTFKTPSGSGVEIPQGAAYLVRSDGTDIVKVYGSAAERDAGVNIGDVVLLEDLGGAPALPAVDGSQLLNIGGGSGAADLQNGLYEAEDSGELFQLPTGINEFDLLYEGGLYHLFYDDKTQTKHRQAATVQGLSSAPDDLTQAGRYPSAFYDGSTWHLYVFNQGANQTEHYTSASASGPYTLQDNLPTGWADFAVAQDPDSGVYYATVKDINAGPTNLKALALSSTSLGGPWSSLGPIFQEGARAGWHQSEEADPCPVFFRGKRYVVFAGWPGAGLVTTRQRIGIVEVDSNFDAIAPPRVLVNPFEDWQIGPQGPKVFSPRALTVDGVTRLFYSHNPGVATSAGWAYLTYDSQSEAPDPKVIFNSKISVGHSDTTKVEIYQSGAPNGVGDIVELSTSPASLIATSPVGELDEFTLVADIDGAPADTVFRRIVSLTEDPDSGVAVGLWIDASGNAYAEVKNTIDPDLVLTTTRNVEGARKRIILRRKATGEVELFVDREIEASASLASPISGIELLRVGNSTGYTIPSGQQFTGKIKIGLYNEALNLLRIP
jgi:hypothetical protein